jgi:hypothetical protein
MKLLFQHDQEIACEICYNALTLKTLVCVDSGYLEFILPFMPTIKIDSSTRITICPLDASQSSIFQRHHYASI